MAIGSESFALATGAGACVYVNSAPTIHTCHLPQTPNTSHLLLRPTISHLPHHLAHKPRHVLDVGLNEVASEYFAARFECRPQVGGDDDPRGVAERFEVEVDAGFDDFVAAHIDGAPGGITGRQARFVALDDDLTIGVDRIFALEAADVWQSWIAQQLGQQVDLVTKNWSTSTATAALSDTTRTRLLEHYAPEYDIYDQLRSAGGSWSVPSGYRPS